MFNSTPMPGENLESAEAREKEREREAIANGENFNPNITNEDAEKFSNLGNEVPFAGDNVIENTINADWAAGKTPDLESVSEHIDQNYIDGTLENAATNPNIAADIAETDRNINDDPDDENAPASHSNQPHDISVAAATQAISADALSKDIENDIKAGDSSRADEAIQRAQEAIASAEKISTAVSTSGANSVEAQMAINIASQANEMAEQAIERVSQAQSEYDAMTTEEKEEAKAAAEEENEAE